LLFFIVLFILNIKIINCVDDNILIKSESRNIIFVGKSRSGKTTSVKVLQNYSYISPYFIIKPDTFQPEQHVFSVKNNDKIYHLTMIDTPGLFENPDVNSEKRGESILKEMITDCLNFEILRINHVYIVVNLGNNLNPDDVKSIEEFSKMFIGIEHKLSLLITFAQEFSDKFRDHMKEQIKNTKSLSDFYHRISGRIFYLGSVSQIDIDNNKDLSVINQNLIKQRDILLEHIYKNVDNFHIKTMKQYKDLIEDISTISENADSIFIENSDNLEKIINVKKFVGKEKDFIKTEESKIVIKGKDEL